MFPLLMADELGDYIVGTAIETIETEKLIGEFEQVILDDVYTKAVPMDDVAQNLQAFLQQRGVKIKTIEVENVYNETETTRENVAQWRGSQKLDQARGKVSPVRFRCRLAKRDANGPFLSAEYS
jgi:hypothetical protein